MVGSSIYRNIFFVSLSVFSLDCGIVKLSNADTAQCSKYNILQFDFIRFASFSSILWIWYVFVDIVPFIVLSSWSIIFANGGALVCWHYPIWTFLDAVNPNLNFYCARSMFIAQIFEEKKNYHKFEDRQKLIVVVFNNQMLLIFNPYHVSHLLWINTINTAETLSWLYRAKAWCECDSRKINMII